MAADESSNFVRCLKAMLVWFLMSAFAGIFTAYFALGAASIVIALLLAVCGMVVHMLLWTLACTPHWSYAGLVFGSATTMLLIIINGSNEWQPIVVFMIFISLSLMSYVIYPVANHVIGASPKRSG